MTNQKPNREANVDEQTKLRKHKRQQEREVQVVINEFDEKGTQVSIIIFKHFHKFWNTIVHLDQFEKSIKTTKFKIQNL